MKPAPSSVSPGKQALRRHYKQLRKAIPLQDREDAAAAIATQGAPLIKRLAQPGATVAGYYPIHGEVSPLKLMAALEEAGYICALPVVAAQNGPLSFHRWATGSRTLPGRYKIPEPPLSAPVAVPDIVLVPLLAFDKTGGRLGYGGGYYDRTLAKLRATGKVMAVGLGFECQAHEGVPREPTDETLDYVITPDSIYACRS